MSNPVDVLERQPLESPPEEIVLGAVRLFRYRAIATVAAIVATTVIGVAALSAASTSDQEERLSRALASQSAQVVVLDAVGTIDGIEFRLTESVWDNGVGFVRVIATETQSSRPEPVVEVDVGEIRVQSSDVNGEQVSSVANQPSLTIGRSAEARSTGSFWVEYESPSPLGDTLSVSFVVVPIPQEFLDNGGVLTSDEDGTTGTITFERRTS